MRQLRGRHIGGIVTEAANTWDPNSAEALERRFTDMVADSWKRWNAWETARRCDDVAVGAVIAS